MAKKEYIVASESVAISALGFDVERDVQPGEALFISTTGHFFHRSCAQPVAYTPCVLNTCTSLARIL